MIEYACSVRSNLIVKSIIIVCEIISWLADVRRTVKRDASDIEDSASSMFQGQLLHKVVSHADNASGHDGKSTQHLAPVGVTDGGLADAQGDKIVDET
jgi:hypothetical protein